MELLCLVGECLLDTYIVFCMEGNHCVLLVSVCYIQNCVWYGRESLCLVGECLLDTYIVFVMEGNYCALWVSVY